ncbi:MAG: HDOD domain-containing protein [Methylophagaceae bacterium]
MSRQGPQNVEQWIRQLNDENMPGFAATITDVTGAINSSDTSAADVAQTILRDPSLTSRLLKMANSLYYNPHKQEISTISRAVMVMGFDQVRAVALSLVLVDSLDDGHQRNKLTEEIAQSFHAAIQAQEFARKSKCKSPEKIFVATLLSRLGNMAFWAFSSDKSTELLALLETDDISEEQAEKTVLGYSLGDLTSGLSKAWSLSDLLEESLNKQSSGDNPQLVNIEIGKKLAQAAKKGWESAEAEQAIKWVSKQLNLKINQVKGLAHANAKQARNVTKLYGITTASKRIPLANMPLIETDSEFKSVNLGINSDLMLAENSNDASEQRGGIVEVLHHEPDTHLQLTILSDISKAIEEKPSINIVLEMVLEGIYRGIGMDRSLFAILSKDHKQLTCKYALGADSIKLCRELSIDISQSDNIFHQIVKSKKAMHIPADLKQVNATLSHDVVELLGSPPYLIMPTIVRDKVIGIYLADRNASMRPIKDSDFVSFQQFCQQANMGLTFLSMQG